MPGELYSRTPQLRLSKTIQNDDFTFDIAVAAVRPPQRDAGVPEGEGGIHLAFNKWTATQTIGATGTTVSPLSVAVTGDVRRVSVPQFSPAPTNANDKTAASIAVDAFIPVLPGTKEHMGNSLGLIGELTTGYGITDMFTGLGTGVGYPALPGAPPAACAVNGGTGCTAVYNPDIDPGLVGYDANGQLHFLQWTAYRVGGQYTFPGLDGKMWISANYSHTQSANSYRFAGIKTAGTLWALDWFDVNLMGDITPAVRMGVEYANYNTAYVDGIHAINHRVQVGAFYIF